MARRRRTVALRFIFSCLCSASPECFSFATHLPDHRSIELSDLVAGDLSHARHTVISLRRSSWLARRSRRRRTCSTLSSPFRHVPDHHRSPNLPSSLVAGDPVRMLSELSSLHWSPTPVAAFDESVSPVKPSFSVCFITVVDHRAHRSPASFNPWVKRAEEIFNVIRQSYYGSLPVPSPSRCICRPLLLATRMAHPPAKPLSSPMAPLSHPAIITSAPAKVSLGFCFLGPPSAGPLTLCPKPINFSTASQPIRPWSVFYVFSSSYSQLTCGISVSSGRGHHLRREPPWLLWLCIYCMRFLWLELSCAYLLYSMCLKLHGLVYPSSYCRRCDWGHQTALSSLYLLNLTNHSAKIRLIFSSHWEISFSCFFLKERTHPPSSILERTVPSLSSAMEVVVKRSKVLKTLRAFCVVQSPLMAEELDFDLKSIISETFW